MIKEIEKVKEVIKNNIEITIYTNILTKEQVKHAVDLFIRNCGVSDDDIITNSQSYEVRIATDNDADMRSSAISIASYVQTLDPKAFVRVRDVRFADTGHGIRWVNDGITVYSDLSIYEDPVYEFHYNDVNDYQIVYIPTYAAKFCARDKERYEKTGAKYMWRCTASWNNFMKAQTIDDAIEEFEAMYREKLWNSVVNEEESLRRTIDKFRVFNEYRSKK